MMKKDWMLDYLCGGKGLIPYEKIKSHKDLDAAAEGDFFINRILQFVKK